ncbi:hypothetical protein FB639_001697 [Coemansia asiatica]|nr:hypothetical protein FB639_001697 [Coemansia asiatica]
MSDEKRVKYTVHSNGDIPALKGDIETGYSYEQPQPQHQRGQRTGHRGRFLKKLRLCRLSAGAPYGAGTSPW